MRTKILVILFFCCSYLAKITAQSLEETVVGVYPIGYASTKVDAIYPSIISGNISDRLNCFTEVEIMDKIVFSTVKQAHEDAKSWMSALTKTIEQGYIKGPEVLVAGFISSVEENFVEATRTHEVSIIIQVYIIDAQTGVSNGNQQFIFSGNNPVGIFLSDTPFEKWGSAFGAKNRVKTIENALKAFTDQLMPFLESSLGRSNCRGGAKASVYKPIHADSKNTIFIKVKQEEVNWKKNLVFFDFLEDESIGPVDNPLGYKSNLIAKARFIGYNGDFAVLQLTRKYKNQANEIMDWINSGRSIYIKRKDKGIAKNKSK